MAAERDRCVVAHSTGRSYSGDATFWGLEVVLGSARRDWYSRSSKCVRTCVFFCVRFELTC